MAKIYSIISTSENDSDVGLFKSILLKLTDSGHFVNVIHRDAISNINIFNRREELHEADVIIPFLSTDSVDSSPFLNENLQLINYAAHNNKLFLPIYSPQININKLPERLLSTILQGVKYRREQNLDELVSKIDEQINLYLGKKLATEEKAQVIQEKIESSAPTYIKETIEELSNRERSYKSSANWWYFAGFIAIIAGVIIAALFLNGGLYTENNAVNWSKTIFFSVKGVFIIVLLLAASKYAFNLAKSYMAESLKIADRIHAISFGKFYLQVFNQQVDPNELKEIFRDWNINNQSSAFTTQNANDYDPLILDKVAVLIDKVKGNMDNKST